MGYKFYTLIIILFFESLLYGQTCFINNLNLPDGSVRSIPLVLSGSNFDLTQDQICKINIKFKHESINQLRMRLISPGGQSLELLGPATALSNTIFPSPTYNLTFVRCTETPDPEPGYDARWRNDQIWIGSTFSGTYHPHIGCLDNFNIGPINGTWQLEIQDVARFDEGIIECFSIEFCNSTNVVSASCDDRKGRLLQQNASICEYDSLRLIPITNFPTGRPSITSYTSRYVVLSGTELISYTTDTLKNLEPGNYTVCHFMVANADISRLPQIGSLISNANFAQEFGRLNLCGSVSDVCMNLTVNPIPAIITDLSLKICRGSNINFKNQIISIPGNYNIYVPSTTAGICDTLYQVRVEEINLSPIIFSSSNILPCNGQLVLTNASLNTSVNALYTFKGPGIVLNTQNSATINQPGMYTMIVSDQGCTDSTRLNIIGDPNLPKLSFIADTITCSITTASITVNTTGQRIISTNWSRGSSLNDSTVTTNQNGKLIATVTHADGCIITDSLIVQIDTIKVKPIFQLSDPDLTCRIRNITTTFQNGNLFEQNLVFKRNGSAISNIAAINEAGSFTVIGQSINNGCIDSTLITINDLQEVPTVRLETFCDNANVFKLRAIIQREPLNLFWTFPTGQTGNAQALEHTITASGDFNFSYISAAGCRSNDTTISVNLSQAFPDFMVEDDSLACDRRNINLNVNIIDPNATYTWTGPNNFSSTNPTPIVNTIGFYSGEARYANGCYSRDVAEVKLKTDETPFNLTSVINILCEDTLKLQPVDKSTYTYTWRTDLSPEILNNIDDTLYTINPGVYILEISQGNDLCYTLPIEVGDERDFPTIVPQKSDITCDPNRPASINLNITNPERIDKLEWTGPNGFTGNSANIQGLDSGRYHYVITTQRGCNIRDTFEIFRNTDAPRISLAQDSLTLICDDYRNIAGRMVLMTPLDPIASATWTREGDAAVLSTNNELTIRRDGRYTIRAIGTNQCETTRSLVVVNDTINANLITLTPVPISCDVPIPTITPIHKNGFRQFNVILSGQIIATNTNSFTVNRGGVYRFESIDNRGCTSVDSFVIEDRTDSIRFSQIITNIGCEPGNIELEFSTVASDIVWLNSALDTISRDSVLEITTAGIYIVNVKSPLGCLTADTFNIIKDDTLPVLSSLSVDTLTCDNPSGIISLVVNRQVRNVAWSSTVKDTVTQNGLLSVNFPGLYKWIITADNGCQISDSVVVRIDTISPRLTFQNDTLTCLRPITFVRAISNDQIRQYLWEGPGNYVSRDSLIRVGVSGTYSLTTIGANGCQSIDFIEVFENKVFPRLTLPDSFNLPCTNDSLLISAISDQPIRDLRWVNGRNLLSRQNDLLTRTTGIIKLFVISEEGCQAEDSTFVYLDTIRAIANLSGNIITCDPDTSFIKATISSPYMTSTWITPSGLVIEDLLNIESQDSGVFRLLVERLPMCVDTFDLLIEADRVKPTLVVSQLNPIKCEVKETTLVGQASHFRRDALIYTWTTVTGNIVGSNSLQSIRVDKSATYTFRAIDTINNCSEAAFISISEDEADLDTFSMISFDPICFAANDGRIQITNVTGGTAPFGISLSSTTPFVRDSTIRNLRAGAYSVFLRDSFGCVKSAVITLNEGERTFVRLPRDTTITLGANIEISYISDVAPQDIRDIIWMAGNGQNCDGCITYTASLIESTELLIVVTNTNGCVAIDSMNISVLPIINWVFPNVLSGSSSLNSALIIPENAGVEIINEFSIYDRWGNKIWQAQNFKPGDPNFVFDVRTQSTPYENGVYLMKIDATLINGLKWQRVKDFTIIK